MPPRLKFVKSPSKQESKDVDLGISYNETLQLYDPKLNYYLIDYVREVEAEKFEDEKEAAMFICPKLARVAHRITSSTLVNIGKHSEDNPCGILKINKKGYYEGGENGAYWVWVEPSDDEEGKKKKKGFWDKRGPFSLLNKSFVDFCSRKIVNIPYHSDLGFSSKTDCFNVFPCFKAEFIEKVTIERCEEICKPVLNHIRKVWANDDNIKFHYTMEHIAYPIRELKRTNVMAVYKGGQGTGKGILADFFENFVYGKACCKQIQGLGEITGQFNCLLRGSALVIIDEASEKADFTCRGRGASASFDCLKRLITGNDFRLTNKNVDSELIANIITYILFTNHDNPIFLEKDDRRYYMNEISAIYAGNRKYFKDLSEAIMNELVGDAFYTLCRIHPVWKCEGWSGNLEDIPNTKLKEDTLKSCRGKSILFLDEIFKEGSIPIKEDLLNTTLKAESVLISSNSLYSMYKVWQRSTNNGEILPQITITKKIKEIAHISDGGRHRDGTERPNYFKIELELYDVVHVKEILPGVDEDKLPVISLRIWHNKKFPLIPIKIVIKSREEVKENIENSEIEEDSELEEF